MARSLSGVVYRGKVTMRSATTRARSLILVLAILAAGGGSIGSPISAQVEAPGSYRLIETWSAVEAPPRAGRVARAIDIGVDAAGFIYVLDEDPPAIHIFRPDRSPYSLRSLPAGLIGLGLDATPSGGLRILTREAADYRVLSMRADGGFETLLRPAPPPGNVYVDIAAGEDRTWLLSRAPSESAPDQRIEAWSRTGSLEISLSPSALFLPGCERAVAVALALDAAGQINLALQAEADGCPDPTAPQPQPGDLRPPPVDGVARLRESGGSLQLEDLLVAGRPDDLSLGPDGIWAVAGSELYRAGETLARERILPEQALGPAAQALSAPRLRLAMSPLGLGLAAGADCPLPGLFRFGGSSPGAVNLGATNRPVLDGPRLPWRLAAASGGARGAEVDILRGALDPRSRGVDPLALGPALQRWSRFGRPEGQVPLCGARGARPQLAAQALDLARGGGLSYAIGSQGVSAHADALLPRWSFADDGAAWIAGDADPSGQLALLDAAGSSVRVLDTAGREIQRWPVNDGPQASQPVDLAWIGGRVYLADTGRREIQVRDPGGALQGSFAVHDAPLRIAAGLDGQVLVLGRAGTGLGYSADGRLLAAWPLPARPGVVPLDISVDPEGRVLVGYARFAPAGPDRDFAAAPVLDGGVWVFEPDPGIAPAPRTPADESCALRPAKRLRPERIPIGAEIEIELAIEGRCPGWHEPQHLAVVLDTAAGPGTEEGLARARSVLVALLGSLDVDNAWLGLASHAEGRHDDLPLAHDIGAVRARIAAARPLGGPSLAEAVGRGRAILAAPPGLPGSRRGLVLASAGRLDDPLLSASLQAARDEGIDVILLAWPPEADRSATIARLAALSPDLQDRFIDPHSVDLSALIARATEYRDEPGLLDRVTLVDRLPANMRYVAGSADPPAVYDASQHRLAWTLGPQPALPGMRLAYRLQPEALGRWPVGLGADADYVDSYGSAAGLKFPEPEVEVFAPPTPAPARPIYLPFALRAACVPAPLPLDIVLVLDISGSMADPAGSGAGSKLDAAKIAARSFVVLLRPGQDRVSLVAFDQGARLALPLSEDRAAFDAALAGLVPGEGTRIDLGLAAAGRALAEARPAARRALVLLTDGLQTGPESAVLEEAGRIKTGGLDLLFTIGLGEDVDASMLAAVASRPDFFLASPDAADLAGLYQRILAVIDCG